MHSWSMVMTHRIASPTIFLRVPVAHGVQLFFKATDNELATLHLRM